MNRTDMTVGQKALHTSTVCRTIIKKRREACKLTNSIKSQIIQLELEAKRIKRETKAYERAICESEDIEHKFVVSILAGKTNKKKEVHNLKSLVNEGV
jgi:hypothetical protein